MILPAIEFETSNHPRFSVIWLHGLGADGSDFVPVAQALSLPDMRFIFPHAPVQPVTLNGGYRMRSWYDIYSLDLKSGEDREGMSQSQKRICALIEREGQRGVACDRVFLAGFSQGGALALYCGLRHPSRLAGIVALSTYLPFAPSTMEEAHPANSETPIFMAHGMWDEIIPAGAGGAAKNELERLGYDVSWHAYEMAHSVCDAEIGDLSDWMRRAISCA